MTKTGRKAELLKLINLIVKLEKEGPQDIARAQRFRRDFGLKQGTFTDLPDSWTKHDREHFVWQANLYAAVADDVFDGWLKTGVESPGFSISYVRKKAQKHRTKMKRAQRQLRVLSEEGLEVYQANIRDVDTLRLGQPAAIITDPPYENDAIPLWADLARFADRVLPEHGWLLAMSGQRWVPEILQAIQGAKTRMKYVWTLAVHTPGGQSSSSWIGERNALCSEWKPMFVFSKGEPGNWPGVGDWTSDDNELPPGLRDFLTSKENDKRYHKWGQSVNVFSRLVENFAAPGQLVVDPFLGGGTTAVVARDLGRAFEGFDIDPVHVTETVERLDEEV